MHKLIYILLLLLPFGSFSQLLEDFSDGDFTSNPAWSGYVTDFTVNASNQLQTDAAVASSSYLSTLNTLTDLNDVEWRFYLKQGFAGSSSNSTTIALTSDNANPNLCQNGYFLLFGEAGSNDAIKLYQIVGGVKTLLMTGALGAVANSFVVSVKITHSASGEWKLYTDYTGGNNYVLEASTTDLNSVAEPYFGIFVQYTISNIKKIFLDNIYVGPTAVDTIAPQIASVQIMNSQKVNITFNEQVDTTIINQTLALTPIVNVDSLVQNINPALVSIYFSTPLTNGATYSCTIPSVKDTTGNDTTIQFSFTYLFAEIPANGDLIINEIMADPTPAVGLPEYDFVEVYNRSSKVFNLQGWKIANTTTTATISATKWLLPGQYVVLTSTSAANLYGSQGVGVTSFPNFKNSADDVVLLDTSGTVIDKISYTTDWYKDNAKKDGGYTLERMHAQLICSGKNNWSASNDVGGGTPSMVNSVNDITVDVLSPKIDTVVVVNPTKLEIHLNEPLDATTVGEINVQSMPSLSTPICTINPTNPSVLWIDLSVNLTTNTPYSLTLNNLKDCQGNAGSSTFSFSYLVSDIPVAGDIIINEVFVDPTPVVGLPEYEYVEVFNRSSKTFNLKGWTIGNNSTLGKINNTIWIYPGEYKVLTSSTGVSSFPNSIYVTSFPSYKNGGDDVVLLDTSSMIIDKISYTLDWYKDDYKKDGGYSLERINPTLICSDISNWTASIDSTGGTPNSINSTYSNQPDVLSPTIQATIPTSDSTITVIFNEPISANPTVLFSVQPNLAIFSIKRDSSVLSKFYLMLSDKIHPSSIYTLLAEDIEDCQGNITPIAQQHFVLAHQPQQGEIVINELLFNPLTGGSDFVELKNNTDKIFNLYDLKLTNYKTGASNTKIILTDYLLYPHGIVVLTPDTLFQKQNYPFTGKQNFIQMSIPSMNNDASTIGLVLDSALTIDSLTYSEKWHFKLLDDVKGKSLERIASTAPSSNASSWHTAAESMGFATPGLENSQATDFLYNGKLTLSSETISPDNDGFEDYLLITYETDNIGYVGSITIFDDRGREVRKLFKNELLGNRGEYTWDGLNDDNQKTAVGSHIILMEGYHVGTGKTFKLKKVIVVAGKH